jgi:hypothetical protein
MTKEDNEDEKDPNERVKDEDVESKVQADAEFYDGDRDNDDGK